LSRDFKPFTQTYAGLTRELYNDIHICQGVTQGLPDNSKLKKYVGIWDTGATMTVVSQKVIDECSLKLITYTKAQTPNGERTSGVYLAAVMLPNGVGFPGMLVVEGEVSGGDALIGMDIITKGDFSITNVNSKTLHSFRTPSIASIDYVAEHNKIFGNPSTIGGFAGVGRNERCPCGSGKKYKHCHGQ